MCKGSVGVCLIHSRTSLTAHHSTHSLSASKNRAGLGLVWRKQWKRGIPLQVGARKRKELCFSFYVIFSKVSCMAAAGRKWGRSQSQPRVGARTLVYNNIARSRIYSSCLSIKANVRPLRKKKKKKCYFRLFQFVLSSVVGGMPSPITQGGRYRKRKSCSAHCYVYLHKSQRNRGTMCWCRAALAESFSCPFFFFFYKIGCLCNLW